MDLTLNGSEQGTEEWGEGGRRITTQGISVWFWSAQHDVSSHSRCILQMTCDNSITLVQCPERGCDPEQCRRQEAARLWPHGHRRVRRGHAIKQATGCFACLSALLHLESEHKWGTAWLERWPQHSGPALTTGSPEMSPIPSSEQERAAPPARIESS